MKTKRILGIWMDHSTAQLSELSNGNFMTETIESKPKSLVNEQDLYYKDESHVLNKEQSELAAYYKKLGDAILNYEEVILFGPTEAKNELFNLMKVDHLFNNIKIGVKHADKMTKSHMRDLIREYFK